MNCDKLTDLIYESDEDASPSLWTRFRVIFHAVHCRHCSEKIRRLEMTKDVLVRDFFPPTGGFDELIMGRIYAEMEENPEESHDTVPFRSWIITGVVIVASLLSALFGINSRHLADFFGTSFILPLGLTIGCIISIYGILFIGTHLEELKELGERFRLHEK
ncbi:peptidoglycan-binding protein [Treponema sp. OttesenSCG-928-L16]|nr:peptidoglycan-binding protein [Treponema sp. OttesenSCG-928-L16]